MTTVLVLGREWEIDRGRRIWGTGGWLSPEEREAIDWITLVRLLGWRAEAAPVAGGERPDVCIVANDPTGEDGASLLEWARLGTTVVAPYESAPPSLRTGLTAVRSANGRSVRWRGGGAPASWTAGVDVAHTALGPGTGWEVLAEVDGSGTVAARRHGSGLLVLMGFDPSAARDASGVMTALLVHLLTYTAPTPVAWLDLARTVVLRMDDPGSGQSVYCRDWCYPKLTSAQWGEVGGILSRRRGRMSVAYSAGFVDDGDAGRGRLVVDGREVPRSPGAVHPSPLVAYEDMTGHRPHAVYDFGDEYDGVTALVAAGAGGVELHGFTHVHPGYEEWAAAPDRYENVDWYRELGPRASAALARLAPGDHPLERGFSAIERWFGSPPTTLVCPGEEWTDETLEVALDTGLSLVGSYYLALRHDDRFCWSTHVCSPYLDEPDARWFDSGLPVVGYMHDRDLVVNGVGWLDEWLSAWESKGATRFADYAWLAAALSTPVEVDGVGGAGAVAAATEGLPPGGALRVKVRTGGPGRVVLRVAGRESPAVDTGGDVVALVTGTDQPPVVRS